MSNSRFTPWFVSEAFYVFSQVILPVVLALIFFGALWLWVGWLYLEMGFESAAPTPYGDLMRDLLIRWFGGKFEN